MSLVLQKQPTIVIEHFVLGILLFLRNNNFWSELGNDWYLSDSLEKVLLTLWLNNNFPKCALTISKSNHVIFKISICWTVLSGKSIEN